MRSELMISPDGRHFMRDGAPFFWLGDTAWLLFRKLTIEQSRIYLQNRAAKGFTVIQATLVHMHGMQTASGSPALLDDKFDTPNPDASEGAYWPHVRRVVEIAAELGLCMALLPAWGSLATDGLLSMENADTYIDFLAAQFGQYDNVLWLVGGDVRGTAAPDVFGCVGARLRERLPHQRIGYHPFGRCSSSTWFHDEPWLDFNMFQSGHRDYTQKKLNAWDDLVQDDEWVGEDSYQYVLRDRALTPPKPTLDGEPSYELIPHGLHDPQKPYWQAHDVRRYAYWSLLSGAAGHTYGDNAIMQFYDGEGKPAYGALQTWDAAMHNPGSMQMGHARRIMQAVDWSKGEPFQEFLAQAEGERYAHIRAMRAPRAACCYLYEGQSVALRLGKLPFARADIWWFDPVVGGISYAGEAEASGERTFTPPERRGGQNDYLLVCTEVSARCQFLKRLAVF